MTSISRKPTTGIENDFFRDFIARSPDPVIVHADFEPLYANDAFLRLLGFASLEELTAFGLENVVASSDRARLQDFHRARIQGKPVADVVHAKLLHRDGSELSIECRVITSMFEGRPCAAVNITDVGFRQVLEQQVSQLRRHLLDAETFAQIGYFRWHRDRSLVELSQQAQILLGVPDGDSIISAWDFVEFFAGEKRDEIWSTMLAMVGQGLSLRIDAVETRDQSRFLDIALKSETDPNTGKAYLFGFLHDVTSEHRQREALGLLARGDPHIDDSFKLAAKALALGLGYRAAGVFRLSDDGKSTCQLARWVDEGYDRWFGEDLEPGKWYPVRGTVCEAIVSSRDTVCVADGVPERFPWAPMSRELDVRACIGTPIFDADGLIVGHVLAMHDKPDRRGADRELVRFIAEWSGLEMEQKKAVAQREAHQKMWESIADTMPAIVMLKDRRGRLTYANKTYLDMFKTSGDEVLGRTIRERVEKGLLNFAGDSLSAIEKLDEQAWHTSEPLPMLRAQATDRDGKSYHWLLAKRRIKDGRDGQPRVLTLGMDIADLVRAEEALVESEAQFRAILQNLPGAVMRLRVRRDGSREYLFASDGLRDLFEIDELPPLENVLELFTGSLSIEDQERFLSESVRAYAAGQVYNTVQLFNIGKAHKWLSLRSHAVAVEPDGWLVESLLMDVSEQFRAELALREREAQLSNLMSNLPGVAWRARVNKDKTRQIQFLSGGVKDLTGFTADEISLDTAAGLRALIGDSDLQQYINETSAAYASGRPYTRTFQIYCRDGSSKWVTQRSRVASEYDDHFIVDGLMLDVTEEMTARNLLMERDQRLRELQAELLQVSRASAMGAMSSAIAHEISQPVAAVSNYLTATEQLLSVAQTELPPKVREYMNKSREQADRAGAVIASLRRFFERGELEVTSEDINEVVDEAVMLALLDRAASDLSTHRVYADGLPPVLIDRLQIQQVVLNLIRNALQAMGDAAAPRIAIRTLFVDNSVMVEVEDWGPGLPPEVADRIFDRHVTSRPDGMGMGLAICKSVLNAHDTALEFRSCDHGGTVFQFSLPLADEVAEGLSA